MSEPILICLSQIGKDLFDASVVSVLVKRQRLFVVRIQNICFEFGSGIEFVLVVDGLLELGEFVVFLERLYIFRIFHSIIQNFLQKLLEIFLIHQLFIHVRLLLQFDLLQDLLLYFSLHYSDFFLGVQHFSHMVFLTAVHQTWFT